MPTADSSLGTDRSCLTPARRKYQELKNLTSLDLTAQDCAVLLPCMSFSQARFETDEGGQVKVMHRQIMNELFSEVHTLTTQRRANISLYVHGPKGEFLCVIVVVVFVRPSLPLRFPYFCRLICRCWQISLFARCCRTILAKASQGQRPGRPIACRVHTGVVLDERQRCD